MINVLFVCLGNICRSPVAEGVFRQLVEENGLADRITCDSVGTASYHIGALPDRRARDNAREHGLQLTHRARRMTGEDLAAFDYFVAMDEANFEGIEKLTLRSVGVVNEENTFLLREFDPDISDQPNVPDPYYEDAAAFEDVYQIALRCGRQLLIYLARQYSFTLAALSPSTET